MAIQLTDALFTPGQMIDFFFRGMFHRLTHMGKLGCQRLALIQGLSTDFAGMVDTHQTGNMTLGLWVQRVFRFDDGRRRPMRLTAERQQCSQGGIGL